MGTSSHQDIFCLESPPKNQLWDDVTLFVAWTSVMSSHNWCDGPACLTLVHAACMRLPCLAGR